ncbi:hypothetical protein Acsp03_70800 [Actinomadura sp. NBRC 104412]|uniref:hypothetical protein n=1 Tax=Actinomadura sp. NBRC 104412 TaxID=3032203 RepID=UPI0024A408BB|nr:hypothetical protein [Actinomadura sp. NBRC 104412]GLZ09614.1 hypothetical protein Acsp03_70800 [Actinomadura sp. NBRC 104412]
MSYSDLRDFCPEVTYHIHGHSTITLSLEKLGGSTPGRAYTGTWRFVITWRGIETFREQTLETRVPTTHLGAAAALADRLATYGDPLSGYDGPRPTGRALDMCQREHHALARWAAEAGRAR